LQQKGILVLAIAGASTGAGMAACMHTGTIIGQVRIDASKTGSRSTYRELLLVKVWGD